MKILKLFLGTLGLGLTIIPAILVFWGLLPFGDHTLWMLIGLLFWFSSRFIPLPDDPKS